MFRILVPLVALTSFFAFIPESTHAEPASQEKSISLFNGRDLTGWKLRGKDDKAKAKSKWVVGLCKLDEKNPATLVLTQAEIAPTPPWIINTAGGVDLISERLFRDCLVEVEFMIPKGSNSGIYLMGQYEVQIIDSFGKTGKLEPGDMGGIYKNAAPKVNACKEPGQWQKFVIEFQAPRFQDGKKTANAKFVKVVFNDQIIHENVEPKGPTGTEIVPNAEIPEGPLMIQGDHGPIAIRSIRVTPR